MTITLTGSNSFALQQRLHQLMSDFEKNHGGLAIERLDGEEVTYDQVLGAIESMPFLASKKLVIIHSLSGNKPAAGQLEKILDAASDTADIVFVEPKPDKRSVFYKTLKKRTELEEFNEPDDRTLATWLVAEAKRREAILSASDANYLIQRVGLNQQLLENELLKLVAYDPKITRQTIDLLTEASPEGTIFNLLDAAFAGNKKRVLELYKAQRAQRVEPQAILAMIVWQLYPVTILQAAGDRSIDEVARDTKLNPFVLRKSKTIADKLSREELSNLLNVLTELDHRFKSEAIDTDEALQYLLLTLAKN
jgi:DNA polymerase-3 subunit delta